MNNIELQKKILKGLKVPKFKELMNSSLMDELLKQAIQLTIVEKDAEVKKRIKGILDECRINSSSLTWKELHYYYQELKKLGLEDGK